MLVKGDIKCLHCGHISGQWVGEGGTPLTFAGFRGPTPIDTPEPSAVIHCRRCCGPVFLDDAALVRNSYRLRRIARMRRQLALYDAERGQAA
jgi:hypothetical protein